MGTGSLSPPMDLATATGRLTMRNALQELVVQLYEQLRDPVRRYLRRLGLTRPAADEVCQEVFLQLFAVLRSGKQVANPRAWIFTVAHNSGLNALSSQGRLRELDEEAAHRPAVAADPEEMLLRDEKLARVHHAVENLPAHQRHCLHLRAEGLCYHEIADIMGLTVSSVAGSLRRAILRIREAVRE